ncbi:uncharacterized protein FTOL_07221 [Fusarium torulosum]|uniref:chitinase n=1 Tax=Fusarium torulosum TaxID=33205 RepID=A0AAE8MBJ6_9HYPO|nr:uncharacterized protein FTOL_07221 [Fusarium torulosum]
MVATNAISLLQGMKKYFDAKDNCNENFLFSYQEEIVANRVFGIFLDTTGDIAAVQKATRPWSEGSSAVGKDAIFSGSLSNAKVYDIAGITHRPDPDEPTSTPTPTPFPSNEPKKLVERLIDFIDSSILRKRATCKHIVVHDGDSCTTLARRCGIRGADSAKYNPQSGLCSSLEEGDHVCCSAGDPYKPSGPKPEADGTCAAHVIDDGDTCAKLAKKHSVTVKELEKWNKNTWAWTDCTDLLKPIIKEGKDQWADFKKLSVKHIVSFAPDKYAIIRNAIITNRETFATNLAKFAKDEGLDGVDIDWEYPGAEDIMVGGSPIGAKTDGVNYLRFLTTLREKLESDMSLSIAAPASYWYLKAFPIDRISKVVDYIVYMTYELHDQWDYGNPNAFDECPSGKCIRSHVLSDATPGRCTKEGGYIANAEINEILLSGVGMQTFYDESSESNILLYKGDYVSYMTDNDRLERRIIWKDFNFAGTIDWAVDLQQFRDEDFDAPPDIPESGQGCIRGEDKADDGQDLCYFSCEYGFCPKSVCTCLEEGELEKLPPVKNRDEVWANDPFNVDLNRLCKFACKYGYCPSQICKRKSSSSAGDENDVPDGIVTVPPDYDEDSIKN